MPQLKKLENLKVESIRFPDGELVKCNQDGDLHRALKRKSKTCETTKQLLQVVDSI